MTGKDHWLRRARALHAKIPPKPRKYAVTVLGSTLLLIGSAMIVLPGPALLVIPAGLAVLGTEYTWAQRLMRRGQRLARRWSERRAKRRSVPKDVVRRGFGVPRAAQH